MDMTKPKGEVVGSITLHFNSKMRVSHVEIKDRGDLVSKRTIQDSMMLMFRAVNQARAKRKTSGRAAKAEVERAESRDTSRLDRYRKKVAAEKAKADQELLDAALARKAEKELAADKAKVPVTPGHVPVKKEITSVSGKPVKDRKAIAKAAAAAEADKMLEAMLAAKKPGPSGPATQPVTAG